MENASKALLIAAGVLIVILLIAFGMRVFNSTTGAEEQIEGAADEIGGAIDKATGVIQEGLGNGINGYLGESKKYQDISNLKKFLIKNKEDIASIEFDITVQIFVGGTLRKTDSIKQTNKKTINAATGEIKYTAIDLVLEQIDNGNESSVYNISKDGNKIKIVGTCNIDMTEEDYRDEYEE